MFNLVVTALLLVITSLRAFAAWRASSPGSSLFQIPAWWPYSDGTWMRLMRAGTTCAPIMAIVFVALAALDVAEIQQGVPRYLLEGIFAGTVFVLMPSLFAYGRPRPLVPPALRGERSSTP